MQVVHTKLGRMGELRQVVNKALNLLNYLRQLLRRFLLDQLALCWKLYDIDDYLFDGLLKPLNRISGHG